MDFCLYLYSFSLPSTRTHVPTNTGRKNKKHLLFYHKKKLCTTLIQYQHLLDKSYAQFVTPWLIPAKNQQFSSTFIIHIHQAAILQQIKIGLIDLTAQDSFHSLTVQIQLDLIALPDAGRIGQPVGLIVNED